MTRIFGITLLLGTFFGLSLIVWTPLAIAHAPAGQAYQDQIAAIAASDDSSLHQVQARIYNAFVESLMAENPAALQRIAARLGDDIDCAPRNLRRYWLGYLHYYEAIFWMQMEDEKQAERATDRALTYLEEIEEKNSEDYALLALVESFGIQFASPLKAPITSAKVQKYGKKALAIDSTNLRAHYVMASNDYYTPERFGGMQAAEDYLLTAISLPPQAVDNPYLPSWGHDLAYEMLIKFYLRKEQPDQARHYFQEAISLYPQNYQLLQLTSKVMSAE